MRNNDLFHLLVLIFIKFSNKQAKTLALADEICVKNIQYYQGPTFMPESGPFCVINKPKPRAYKDIEVIRSEDIFEQLGLVKSNDSKINKRYVIEVKDNSGKPQPFVIPTSAFDDKCTGIQDIEIGRNITESCIPTFTILDRETCERNPFLSIEELIGPVIHGIYSDSNDDKYGETVDTPIRHYPFIEILHPVWSNGTCINVLKEATFLLSDNKNIITDAVLVSLEYFNLTMNNLLLFKQKFSFNFVKEINSQEVNNNTQFRGYEMGDNIISKKDNQQMFLTVPTVGDCSNQQGVSVKFGQAISTGCNIQINSCNEAQSILLNFYNQHLPDYILSEHLRSQYFKEIPAVGENLTIHGNQKNAGCMIISSFRLGIAYARQGFEDNFFTVIVGVSYSYTVTEITVTPNRIIPVPYEVYFRDVTQDPSPKFSALPHINLRLPKDFFYPFVSSSQNQYILTVIIFLSIFNQL